MIRKLKNFSRRSSRFLRLPFYLKRSILEAFLFTAVIRFCIVFLPVHKLASRLGTPLLETPDDLSSEQTITAREISFIVQKISQFTPWSSRCLVQALSTQIMLKRRKIPSTVYLGIAKEGCNALKAHAWLRCGNTILTGSTEMGGYRQISCFGCFIDK